MKDLAVRSKVLKEIMGLMDEKEGDKLKMHPKLMAMKIEKIEPMEKGKMMGSPLEELNPSEDEKAESELDSEEIDPETLAELVKLLKK